MASDAVAISRTQVESRPWLDTLHEWVTTVDHKRIGLLYIAYALLFLIVEWLVYERDGARRIANTIRRANPFAARRAGRAGKTS